MNKYTKSVYPTEYESDADYLTNTHLSNDVRSYIIKLSEVGNVVAFCLLVFEKISAAIRPDANEYESWCVQFEIREFLP